MTTTALNGSRPDLETLLIVDDDRSFCTLLESHLRREGRSIVIAHTGTDALRILAEQEITLVLLDLVLPDLDGRVVLERMREHPRTSWLPVFVLSVRNLVPLKIECFRLGADQFFEKPIDSVMLQSAVDGCLSRRSDFVRLARTDALTGMPNRTAFNDAFARVCALAQRNPIPVSLAILDLDHFKSINDTHGHEVGDLVLRHACRHLTKGLRESDVSARWGGDELVVLMPGTNAAGAAEALRGIQRSLAEHPLVLGNGQSVQVGFSAGVVDGVESLLIDDAVAAADRLLYRAKEGGRSRVVHSGDAAATPAKTVLFAEDDPACAELIRHWLAREGYEAVHARNGREALSCCQTRRPHLVMLDLQMPNLDGFEVLAALRQSSLHARIPIVMLTVAGAEEIIVRAFEMGADDFVTKPFAPQALLARIRRLLVRR